jgi:hypothetical protein
MMKKLVFIILLFFGFITLNAQTTYSKSVKVEDLGSWNKTVSSTDKINVSSYVTKQKILPDVNSQEKLVNNLPKYRYELVVKSNSIYNGKLTKTWIYGARVFIDDKEATASQSPDGFTIIINTEPTVIFRYDSNLDTINIKITWKSSNYFQGK